MWLVRALPAAKSTCRAGCLPVDIHIHDVVCHLLLSMEEFVRIYQQNGGPAGDRNA